MFLMALRIVPLIDIVCIVCEGCWRVVFVFGGEVVERWIGWS